MHLLFCRLFPSPPWLAHCSHAPVGLCLDKLCQHSPASPGETKKILSMEVSIDGSTTKSSIVIGFSRKFIMHFGVPPSMETSIFISRNWGMTILQYGDSSSNSWLSQTVRVLSSENHAPKLWRNSATVEASPQVPASVVDTKKRTMKKLPATRMLSFTVFLSENMQKCHLIAL